MLAANCSLIIIIIIMERKNPEFYHVKRVKITRLAFDRDKLSNLKLRLWTLDFFNGLGMTQCYQFDQSVSVRLLKVSFGGVIHFL